MPRTVVRLLFWTLVSAATVLGQQSLYTLRVDVPWVSLDVSVTDNSGKSISNLTLDDFQVFENGVPQKIDAFTPVSSQWKHRTQVAIHAAGGRRLYRKSAAAGSPHHRFFRLQLCAGSRLDVET